MQSPGPPRILPTLFHSRSFLHFVYGIQWPMPASMVPSSKPGTSGTRSSACKYYHKSQAPPSSPKAELPLASGTFRGGEVPAAPSRGEVSCRLSAAAASEASTASPSGFGRTSSKPRCASSCLPSFHTVSHKWYRHRNWPKVRSLTPSHAT